MNGLDILSTAALYRILPLPVSLSEEDMVPIDHPSLREGGDVSVQDSDSDSDSESKSGLDPDSDTDPDIGPDLGPDLGPDTETIYHSEPEPEPEPQPQPEGSSQRKRKSSRKRVKSGNPYDVEYIRIPPLMTKAKFNAKSKNETYRHPLRGTGVVVLCPRCLKKVKPYHVDAVNCTPKQKEYIWV